MHAYSRWRSGHSLNTHRVYRHEILKRPADLVLPWLWRRPALVLPWLLPCPWHIGLPLLLQLVGTGAGPSPAPPPWLARLVTGRAMCMAPRASPSCVSRGSWWLGAPVRTLRCNFVDHPSVPVFFYARFHCKTLCDRVMRGLGYGSHIERSIRLSGRARVRSIRAADRYSFGAYRHRRFIVGLSSLSLAPRSLNYRRYIRRYIDDVSTIFELRVTFCLSRWASVKGSRGPCLKGSHLKDTRHQ